MNTVQFISVVQFSPFTYIDVCVLYNLNKVLKNDPEDSGGLLFVVRFGEIKYEILKVHK